MPLLREAGHEAIAVDLPGDDETAGLPEYTSLVTGATGSPPSGFFPPGPVSGKKNSYRSVSPCGLLVNMLD